MTTDEDLVMPRGQVGWGDSPELLTVTTLEELDALFDRIDQEARARKRPVVANVGLGGTRHFSIGLGADESFVATDDNSTWETWCVRGDMLPDDADPDDYWFWFGNQPTFYPPWALLPAASARRVAGELFATGERPGWVTWEER